MADRSWVAQLKKGTVELTVLAALQRGEAYGYELLQRLESTGVLATSESTLYPALSRLCAAQFVVVRQAPSPAGPPRRYYALTELGEAHLHQLRTYWGDFTKAVEKLLIEAD